MTCIINNKSAINADCSSGERDRVTCIINNKSAINANCSSGERDLVSFIRTHQLEGDVKEPMTLFEKK